MVAEITPPPPIPRGRAEGRLGAPPSNQAQASFSPKKSKVRDHASSAAAAS